MLNERNHGVVRERQSMLSPVVVLDELGTLQTIEASCYKRRPFIRKFGEQLRIGCLPSFLEIHPIAKNREPGCSIVYALATAPREAIDQVDLASTKKCRG